MIVIGKREVWGESEEQRLCGRDRGLCMKIKELGRFIHGNGLQRS